MKWAVVDLGDFDLAVDDHSINVHYNNIMPYETEDEAREAFGELLMAYPDKTWGLAKYDEDTAKD